MIRVFLIVIVVFILLALFVGVLASPGLSLVGKCFTQASNGFHSSNQKLKQIASQTERKAAVCQDGQENFNNLTACLKEAKNNQPIGFAIARIVNVDRIVKETIESHNKLCSPALTPPNL